MLPNITFLPVCKIIYAQMKQKEFNFLKYKSYFCTFVFDELAELFPHK